MFFYGLLIGFRNIKCRIFRGQISIKRKDLKVFKRIAFLPEYSALGAIRFKVLDAIGVKMPGARDTRACVKAMSRHELVCVKATPTASCRVNADIAARQLRCVMFFCRRRKTNLVTGIRAGGKEFDGFQQSGKKRIL